MDTIYMGGYLKESHGTIYKILTEIRNGESTILALKEMGMVSVRWFDLADINEWVIEQRFKYFRTLKEAQEDKT